MQTSPKEARRPRRTSPAIFSAHLLAWFYSAVPFAEVFFKVYAPAPFLVAADPISAEWDACKQCTRNERIFCYTTMRCMNNLHIDMSTTKIFAKCPNPLMVPESCRSKGIYPPTEEQKEQYRQEHAYEEELRAQRRAGGIGGVSGHGEEL
ncbi:unnamed protein product [Amoebophrya sp. A120]|nr:unnamed protein product [Amoebophrya sp. A120]|eukprot:GSA120T00003134001.1